MKQYTQEKHFCTEKSETWSVLEQIARERARKMLQQALELEVEEYIQAHTQDTQSPGRKTVVRNGYHPSRSIISGMEPLLIRQPRVDDRKEPQKLPKLAIGDGALGFWAALEEVFSQTSRQRCWVHKTANTLDKMPKSMQSKLSP